MAGHGEPGVRHLIRTMMAEIDLELALCGLTSIKGIDRSVLAD
jgi:isopentenyl diphosphate isomerase/L-lactate dehydrogenase-like FMN-dependent dehydrogenase